MLNLEATCGGRRSCAASLGAESGTRAASARPSRCVPAADVAARPGLSARPPSSPASRPPSFGPARRAPRRPPPPRYGSALLCIAPSERRGARGGAETRAGGAAGGCGGGRRRTGAAARRLAMYCAYPVPGVGSSSLMYYYNGKTVRGRLCSPRRGGASLRRCPRATCWRAGGRGLRKGSSRRAGTARKSAVRSAAGPGPSSPSCGAAAGPGRGCRSEPRRAGSARGTGRGGGTFLSAGAQLPAFACVNSEQAARFGPCARYVAVVGRAPNGAQGDADIDLY